MTCLSQRAWTAAQDASPIEVSFEFSLPASEQAFERLKNTTARTLFTPVPFGNLRSGRNG